jgi:hypothetical protein
MDEKRRISNIHRYAISLSNCPKLSNNPRIRTVEYTVALEPIQITRSIAAGCKARCLRCRPKMFSTWRKPRLRAFLACRLGLELFARPHNDPVIRISSKSNHHIKRKESAYLFVNSFLTDQNLFVF